MVKSCLIHSYDDCIRDCETALSLNSNYTKGYGRLGMCYVAIGDYKRALESYVKALAISPKNKELLEEEEKCKRVLFLM